MTDLLDLPPQNLDAERSVLGCILVQNDSFDEIAEVLSPENFYADAHQTIYRVAAAMWERHGGTGIDIITLGEELERRGQLDDVGGIGYLAELLEVVPHAAHARYYARIVKDKSLQRSIQYAATDMLRDLKDGSLDTEQMLANASDRICGLLESGAPQQAVDLMTILIQSAERRERGEQATLPTGFYDLDRLTGGLPATTGLVLVAARPSMGKTAFIANVAVQVARDFVPVLFFSLEQATHELADRILAGESRVPKGSHLSEEDRFALMEASDALGRVPLFIDDKPHNVAQISAIVRQMKRKRKIGLVIIDYLQLIEPANRREPREQQVAEIARSLKNLSKSVSSPIVALTQLNRQLESRENKEPRLSDLRESGSLEQEADQVWFIHRGYVHDPTNYDPTHAKLIVGKNRNGPIGAVFLNWRADITRFENKSREADIHDPYAA